MSATLHPNPPPPSSPSPGPAPGPNGRASPNPAAANGAGKMSAAAARASMGPSRSPAGNSPLPSPRPAGMIGLGRPTSELLAGGQAGAFQTPEAEAIDQWFENLQNYEATLEEMAAASLDVNFKEELSAIEQWFRVLSEAERTAALYSLLQHSTQVQIRFFITVLQQMARADPMTALLSPAVGGSMQAQMEAKLQSIGLKSPGLKPPGSPARNFSANAQRQSLDPSTFLSVDSPPQPVVSSPTLGASGDPTAAATLAQQRAKLKANRISAPAPLTQTVDSRGWGAGANQLGQVAERTGSPSNGDPSGTREAPESPSLNDRLAAPSMSTRPKSTDFSGVANSFKARASLDNNLDEQLSPMMDRNWASLVNTPLVPMFDQGNAGGGNTATNSLDAATMKLANWSLSNTNPSSRVVLDDARKFRRTSSKSAANDGGGGVYGDDGNLIAPGGAQPGRAPVPRNVSGASNNGMLSGQAWPAAGGARSPALSNVSSGRFGSDDGALAAAAAAGFGMGAPAGMGLGMPMGMMGGLGNLGAFGMLNPMGAAAMNMNMAGFNPALAAMGPEAQAHFLAAAQAQAQMGWAAQGAFGAGGPGARGGPGSARSLAGSARGPGGSRAPSGGAPGAMGAKEKEEEVDPALLGDVPAWLRSLRLHKYTPNFEGMKWQDMVVLSEEQLEQKGVAALGARRKMLKTFELVREKMGV